jgi:hypothetical protein
LGARPSSRGQHRDPTEKYILTPERGQILGVIEEA